MQVTWRSGGAFFSGSRPNGGVETVLSPNRCSGEFPKLVTG